ncbi:hypothetical protein FKW77_007411 [Venturia effusa]|uniref:Rab proteins geranylgeranyltransferase n=1 Tax=Venturia effusa TaxID=50376 RepID=A0A517L3P7_9PEZI|nr:hypothetical protein FKW77_007411 [Venturia effusa]
MDTLDKTEWDILIDGTGLHQSLLALALSRSTKRVLHVDSNDYYGGDEAALSLQDATAWVKQVGERGSQGLYSQASIQELTREASNTSPSLGFSRAYSLALAPQLIYTESKLLPYLVSSKTYRQLEFLAMGSWWVFSSGKPSDKHKGSDSHANAAATLMRIPTTREDVVFSDKSIDLRSKRAVMKVLRFFTDYENQQEIWEPFSSRPFSEFLNEQFKLPPSFHGLFFALTLSLEPPNKTYTSFALPRIARHLRSTGKLGAGFNSVIPKWGGLSEIAQVACRAGAVGGGVYVLAKGVKQITQITQADALKSKSTEAPSVESMEVTGDSNGRAAYTVDLDGGDIVSTEWLAGTKNISSSGVLSEKTISRAILIISSPLIDLFPTFAEGSPPPAGSVVVFPSESLPASGVNTPPVYLIIHASDTGECPAGQSVLYATTSGDQDLITAAIAQFTQSLTEAERPEIIWQLRYQQRVDVPPNSNAVDDDGKIITFSAFSADLAFDENVLDSVKAAWQKITGGQPQDFMVFEDRNPVGDDDEDE